MILDEKKTMFIDFEFINIGKMIYYYTAWTFSLTYKFKVCVLTQNVNELK